VGEEAQRIPGLPKHAVLLTSRVMIEPTTAPLLVRFGEDKEEWLGSVSMTDRGKFLHTAFGFSGRNVRSFRHCRALSPSRSRTRQLTRRTKTKMKKYSI